MFEQHFWGWFIVLCYVFFTSALTYAFILSRRVNEKNKRKKEERKSRTIRWFEKLDDNNFLVFSELGEQIDILDRGVKYRLHPCGQIANNYMEQIFEISFICLRGNESGPYYIKSPDFMTLALINGISRRD